MLHSYTPEPHVLDARGLATLRVGLALFVLYDLSVRYGDGGLDLAWYTSYPEGILAAADTPHPHAIHRVWFYRGSAACQRVLFASTAATAIAFLLGMWCTELGATPIALYLQVCALHGRCEAVNDGSDRFLRTVLLWSVLLPMGARWSIRTVRSITPGSNTLGLDTIGGDPHRADMRAARSRASDVVRLVRGVAPLGLTAQHVLMYWGTVAFRWRGHAWWCARAAPSPPTTLLRPRDARRTSACASLACVRAVRAV